MTLPAWQASGSLSDPILGPSFDDGNGNRNIETKDITLAKKRTPTGATASTADHCKLVFPFSEAPPDNGKYPIYDGKDLIDDGRQGFICTSVSTAAGAEFGKSSAGVSPQQASPRLGNPRTGGTQVP